MDTEKTHTDTHIPCRLGKNCTVYFRFPFLLTFHSNSCFFSFFLLLGCCFFQPSHLFLFFAFITTYKNHGVSTTADQDTVTDFFFCRTFYIVPLHGRKKKSQSSICLTRWLKNTLMSWGERLDAVPFMFISGLLDMLSKADCYRLRVTID